VAKIREFRSRSYGQYFHAGLAAPGSGFGFGDLAPGAKRARFLLRRTPAAARPSYKKSMSHNDQLVSRLKAALAEELREVRVLMEQIAETLTSDEQLAMAYTEQLQGFDLAIQRAEESAAVLDRMAEGSHPMEAIEGVRLSAVQERLYAALKAA